MELPFEYTVNEQSAGQRVDASLAAHLPDFSRAHLRRAIDAGGVLVDGVAPKPSHKLAVGERVVVERLAPPPAGPEPEAIPLDLLYEDDWLVAVNKPPGMIVHPAKGHWAGTLASALAHHFGDQLSATGGPTRPGIVHRLDRDTSGVIVVAKTDQAHERLAAQFKDRTTEKEYLAIVQGVPDRDADIIDEPIGPHPHHRERMAIRRDHHLSRDALTKYEVIERFSRHAVLRCLPKTGRTHQIRVHLAHIGTPVLCDKLYSRSSIASAYQLLPPKKAYQRRLTGDQTGHDAALDRQALHAHRLAIDHPESGERLSFESPMPEDFLGVIRLLGGVG